MLRYPLRTYTRKNYIQLLSNKKYLLLAGFIIHIFYVTSPKNSTIYCPSGSFIGGKSSDIISYYLPIDLDQ